jgi:hypothetical protein
MPAYGVATRLRGMDVPRLVDDAPSSVDPKHGQIVAVPLAVHPLTREEVVGALVAVIPASAGLSARITANRQTRANGWTPAARESTTWQLRSLIYLRLRRSRSEMTVGRSLLE